MISDIFARIRSFPSAGSAGGPKRDHPYPETIASLRINSIIDLTTGYAWYANPPKEPNKLPRSGGEMIQFRASGNGFDIVFTLRYDLCCRVLLGLLLTYIYLATLGQAGQSPRSNITWRPRPVRTDRVLTRLRLSNRCCQRWFRNSEKFGWRQNAGGLVRQSDALGLPLASRLGVAMG